MAKSFLGVSKKGVYISGEVSGNTIWTLLAAGAYSTAFFEPLASFPYLKAYLNNTKYSTFLDQENASLLHSFDDGNAARRAFSSLLRFFVCKASKGAVYFESRTGTHVTSGEGRLTNSLFASLIQYLAATKELFVSSSHSVPSFTRDDLLYCKHKKNLKIFDEGNILSQSSG